MSIIACITIIKVYSLIFTLISLSFEYTSCIFLHPSSKVVPVLKTAAYNCIFFCMSKRKSAVGTVPLLNRNLSMLAIDSSPAFYNNYKIFFIY